MLPSPPPGAMPISRRSWAIMPARMSWEFAPVPAAAPDAAGNSAPGTMVAAAGEAATCAAFPANFTGVWHFGHLTVNARSGALASSTTTLWAHLGQVASTGLPFDQVVQLGLRRGRAPPGRSRLPGLDPHGRDLGAALGIQAELEGRSVGGVAERGLP